jgi:hypothetical protein
MFTSTFIVSACYFNHHRFELRVLVPRFRYFADGVSMAGGMFTRYFHAVFPLSLSEPL